MLFVAELLDKFDTASFYSSFSVETQSAPDAVIAIDIIALYFLHVLQYLWNNLSTILNFELNIPDKMDEESNYSSFSLDTKSALAGN